jgi:hypothetical protein
MSENPQVQEAQPQTQQESIFSKALQDSYVIPVIKPLKRLPIAFHLVLSWYVMKVELPVHHHLNVIDCRKYVSRSGMTVNGCMNEEGEDLRGLYIATAPPALEVRYRAKISRNEQELKNAILSEIGIEGNLLIEYDNWGYNVYDKFRKAFTIVPAKFDVEQGNLKIIKVPPPSVHYTQLPDFNLIDSVEIYNHRLSFDKKVHAKNVITYSTGIGYLIYATEETEVKAESSDHEPISKKLSSGWYLIVHRKPFSFKRPD